MRKIKDETKRWLIAISITLTYFIPFLVIGFGTPCLLVWLLDSGDYEGTENYEDGSVVEYGNGPLFDHIVFDDYSVTYEGEGRYNIKRMTYPEEYFDFADIVKYAFDPDGYIAYHVFDDEKHEYRIFDANNNDINTFASMKDMYTYCEEKSIELREWYFGSVAEMTIVDINGWTLTGNQYGYFSVRNNHEELFNGEIDRCFYTGRYLAFHFQHVMESRYDDEINPVITYNEDVSCGKKYSGILWFFVDIHTDKYIFVDTQTDKYSIFENKEAIEEYAGSLGISPNWEKVKYDEK